MYKYIYCLLDIGRQIKTKFWKFFSYAVSVTYTRIGPHGPFLISSDDHYTFTLREPTWIANQGQASLRGVST